MHMTFICLVAVAQHKAKKKCNTEENGRKMATAWQNKAPSTELLLFFKISVFSWIRLVWCVVCFTFQFGTVLIRLSFNIRCMLWPHGLYAFSDLIRCKLSDTNSLLAAETFSPRIQPIGKHTQHMHVNVWHSSGPLIVNVGNI